MEQAVLGKGSMVFLGADETTDLVLADLVAHVKTIATVTQERNLIDVDAELDSTTEEKVVGLKKAISFTIVGNYRKNEDNAGYDKVLAAFEKGSAVKFGVVKSTGYGFGGLCLVNKVEDSEVTNEGVMGWTAEITTTGEVSDFEVPKA